MIDIYSWPTPNGHKVHIMLEECGLDWQVHAIDFGKGEQFAPDFLAISPNNRIPAMIDHDGINGKIALFESAAILLYLSEKVGKFMPERGSDNYFTHMQWLMWQMGGVGPMFGQAHHFRLGIGPMFGKAHHFRLFAPEKVPYGIKRYTEESQRLYRVMDKQLATNAYLAGDEYSIVDMATFPWARLPERKGADIADYPNVQRWFDDILARPAVQRGLEVLSDVG